MITSEYLKSVLSKGKFHIVPLNIEIFEAIRALSSEEVDEILAAARGKTIEELQARRDKLDAEILAVQEKTSSIIKEANVDGQLGRTV